MSQGSLGAHAHGRSIDPMWVVAANGGRTQMPGGVGDRRGRMAAAIRAPRDTGRQP